MDVSAQVWYTLEEYAKRLSIAPNSLKEAIERGRIPQSSISLAGIGGRGGKAKRIMIHQPTADIAWVESENTTSKRTKKAREAVERIRAELEANGAPPVAAPIEQTPTSEAPPVEKTTLAEALRREKVAAAALKHLQVLEKQGTLVKKEVVYSQLFRIGKELRDEIMSIPNRITADIAACGGNKTKIRNILRAEFTTILQKIADIDNNNLG